MGGAWPELYPSQQQSSRGRRTGQHLAGPLASLQSLGIKSDDRRLEPDALLRPSELARGWLRMLAESSSPPPLPTAPKPALGAQDPELLSCPTSDGVEGVDGEEVAANVGGHRGGEDGG